MTFQGQLSDIPQSPLWFLFHWSYQLVTCFKAAMCDVPESTSQTRFARHAHAAYACTRARWRVSLQLAGKINLFAGTGEIKTFLAKRTGLRLSTCTKSAAVVLQICQKVWVQCTSK